MTMVTTPSNTVEVDSPELWILSLKNLEERFPGIELVHMISASFKYPLESLKLAANESPVAICCSGKSQVWKLEHNAWSIMYKA